MAQRKSKSRGKNMENYFSRCGLYCGACPYLVATETDTLTELSERLKTPVDELKCAGCHYRPDQDCEFHTCEQSAGIQSCAECSDVPCLKIIALNNDEWEHHSVVIANLTRIKEIGKTAWLKEQQEQWKCRNCGARTEWYQKECKQCQTKL